MAELNPHNTDSDSKDEQNFGNPGHTMSDESSTDGDVQKKKKNFNQEKVMGA